MQRLGTKGALIALIAVATPAPGAGAQPFTPSGRSIAEEGMVNHGTPACASCHGFQGQGVQSQNAPRLSGLNANYLVRQLQAFKKGAKTGRDSQRMSWVARSLTDDQMQVVADYYAGLPPVGAKSEGVKGDVALGATLAHQGNWGEKVPPCASCHGGDGLGVNDLSPPIAGQRADYIVRELNRFRANERRDDPLGLMRGISSRLTPREMQAVAAYYATLPPKPVAQKAVRASNGAPRR